MALDGGPGGQAQMTRRWRALWALANLGDNLTRFDKLSPDRQEAVLAGFEQEAAGEGDRAAWAAAALACLQDRKAGKPNSLGVDEVLVRCSADANPFLREIAVFALNFWDGPDVEDALVARLDDRGEGEELLADFAEGDKNHDVQQFTKTPGLVFATTPRWPWHGTAATGRPSTCWRRCSMSRSSSTRIGCATGRTATRPPTRPPPTTTCRPR